MTKETIFFTKQGMLTLPAIVVPQELYTEERIAEFERDDKELGTLLDRHEGFVRR